MAAAHLQPVSSASVFVSRITEKVSDEFCPGARCMTANNPFDDPDHDDVTQGIFERNFFTIGAVRGILLMTQKLTNSYEI